MPFLRYSFFRASLGFAGAFVLGWSGQNWVNPRPLTKDLWAKAEREQAMARGRRPMGLGKSQSLSPEMLEVQKAAGFSLEALLGLKEPFDQLARLVEFLKTATTAQIAALLPEIQKIAHPTVRAQALKELFSAWCAQDLAGALAAAKAAGSDQDYCERLVWHHWARLNPEGAMAEMKRLGMWHRYAQNYMEGLSEADPIRALETYGNLSFSDQCLLNDLDFLISQAARNNPKTTLQWLAKSPVSESFYQSFLRAIEPSTKWADFLPEVEKLPVSTLRLDMITSIMWRWFEQDADQAQAYLRRMPKGRERDTALFSAVEHLRLEDPLMALRLCQELYSVDTLPKGLLSKLCSSNGTKGIEAAKAVYSQMSPPQRLQASRYLMDSLANKLSVGAEWVRQQPITTLDSESLSRVSQFLPSNEWSPYLDQIEHLNPLDQQVAHKKYAKSLVEKWLKEPASVEQRMEALVTIDPRLQQAAAATFLGSDNRVFKAEEKLAFFDLLAPETQTKVALPMVVGLANNDPAKAAEILTQFQTKTEPVATAVAAERITRAWMEMDSIKASAWVGQLPAGDIRDAAVIALVAETAKLDPAAARQWAETVTGATAKLEVREVLATTPKSN